MSWYLLCCLRYFFLGVRFSFFLIYLEGCDPSGLVHVVVGAQFLYFVCWCVVSYFDDLGREYFFVRVFGARFICFVGVD